jgi:hypothetical protein
LLYVKRMKNAETEINSRENLENKCFYQNIYREKS